VSDWSLLSADNLSTLGVIGVVLVLLVTGRLLSRKTADRELSALIAGHAAKDEAHAQLIALRDEQIALLRDSNRRKIDVIDKKDAQLQVLLDEIAPALQMWADATSRVVEGGGGNAPVLS